MNNGCAIHSEASTRPPRRTSERRVMGFWDAVLLLLLAPVLVGIGPWLLAIIIGGPLVLAYWIGEGFAKLRRRFRKFRHRARRSGVGE